MKIQSRGTPDFWRLYQDLPQEVKEVARKNYRFWSENAFHPSLHFKSIGKPNWSVRVGNSYRAVGIFIGHEFVWQWIGSHEDYNKRY